MSSGTNLLIQKYGIFLAQWKLQNFLMLKSFSKSNWGKTIQTKPRILCQNTTKCNKMQKRCLNVWTIWGSEKWPELTVLFRVNAEGGKREKMWENCGQLRRKHCWLFWNFFLDQNQKTHWKPHFHFGAQRRRENFPGRGPWHPQGPPTGKNYPATCITCYQLIIYYYLK